MFALYEEETRGETSREKPPENLSMVRGESSGEARVQLMEQRSGMAETVRSETSKRKGEREFKAGGKYPHRISPNRPH